MAIKKNDFIEVEFTGNITNTDEIFDTNIEKDAKKAGMDTKDIKPFILSVGHKMLPSGFDNDLIGKETEKSYEVNLKPEDAFGKRNPQMVRMIPTKHFHEQKINPERGMKLALDGQLVKILSTDKGRTLVDFNNPLAGKPITYIYKINKIVTDQKEKINALQDFLFRRTFEFDIKDKDTTKSTNSKEGEALGNLGALSKTVTFKVEKQFEPFVKMFAPKFEEILDMKIEAEVIETKAEEKKE